MIGDTIRPALERFRQRQRQPVPPPVPVDTQHTCRHCGHTFVGRLCPMCGMPGGWERFSISKLFYGFLDIWGLGNRPMFRSMGHLLWRPGYMIRDYLAGHYLSYFPPFKMLAVVTVLVAFTIWVLGVDMSAFKAVMNESTDTDTAFAPALELFSRARDFLYNNTLYRILFQVVIMVFAVWIVFRRQGLNIVETFFAMVYISCQMQLVTIAWLILTRYYVVHSIYPYALPEALAFLLLVVDFRQLYRLRLWGACWRTALMTAVFLVLLVATTILVVTATLAVATLMGQVH